MGGRVERGLEQDYLSGGGGREDKRAREKI